MAAFYLLPSRPQLAESFTRYCQSLFPGVVLDDSVGHEMLEVLLSHVDARRETFTLHREDLPADEPIEIGLRDGFGAETGDRVLEIRLPERMPIPTVRVTTSIVDAPTAPMMICYNDEVA